LYWFQSTRVARIVHALATPSDPGGLRALCHHMNRTETDAPVVPALAGASNERCLFQWHCRQELLFVRQCGLTAPLVSLIGELLVPLVTTSLNGSE